jgi:hypothetical protein
MPITKQDYLDAMAGKASDEVVAAVVAELQNEDSALCALLTGAQKWSRKRLSSAVNRPWLKQLPDEKREDKPITRFFRQSASKKRSQIIEDYLLYLQGNASPEIKERLRLAICDPGSELSITLRGVKKNLPRAKPSRVAQDDWRTPSGIDRQDGEES